jgi:periplasmic divalent cation tolerance protein
MADVGDQPVLIYTTFASREAAEQVGGRLVGERLAACVNIFPGMTSIYSWEGALERTEEVGMLVKTRRARAEAAIAALSEWHPYETPAVMLIPTEDCSADFSRWIAAMTRPVRT